MSDVKPGDTPVTITTMYNYATQQPLVCLAWGDRMPERITVAMAREIAGMLERAAESAEQDGFLVVWLGKVGQPEEAVPQLLQEFQEWCESQRSG